MTDPGLVNGTDTAFVLDALGSPAAIVKANGTLAATYQYDPYGNATTTDEASLGTSNLVRYTGGIYDSTTGFTKFGQRWYNPQQGRFTQQDSLSFVGDPRRGNRYAYAGGNPINYIDPTGQRDWLKVIGLGLEVVGTAIVGGAAFASCPASLVGCGGGLVALGYGIQKTNEFVEAYNE